jgi:hypothetical protein
MSAGPKSIPVQFEARWCGFVPGADSPITPAKPLPIGFGKTRLPWRTWCAPGNMSKQTQSHLGDNTHVNIPNFIDTQPEQLRLLTLRRNGSSG